MQHLKHIKPDYGAGFFERQAHNVATYVQEAAQNRITNYVAADEGKFKRTMVVAKYVLGFLSVVTAFSFLSILFYYWMTGNNLTEEAKGSTHYWVAAAAAIVILTLLEASMSASIAYAYKRWLYTRRADKLTLFFAFLAVVLLSLSALTSVNGAEIGITNKSRIKRDLNETAAQMQYENRAAGIKDAIKGIEGDIAAKRQRQKDLKKKGSGFTWAGALTAEGAKLSKQLDQEIAVLEGRKTDLIERTNESLDKMQGNLARTVELKEATDNGYSSLMLWLSIVNELLIVVAVVYVENFNYRTDVQHNPELQPAPTENEAADYGTIPLHASNVPTPKSAEGVKTQSTGVKTQSGARYEDDEEEVEAGGELADPGFVISAGKPEDMTIEMVDQELAQIDIRKAYNNLTTARNQLENIRRGHNPKNRREENVRANMDKWQQLIDRHNELAEQKAKLEKMLQRVA